MNTSTQWATYHSKSPACNIAHDTITITNIVTENGFEDYIFSAQHIQAIYLAYMKTLNNSVSHTCWLVVFEDGKELIFSPEARKSKSDEGKHVTFKKAFLNHYEMIYAVYTKEAFRKYRGEYTKKHISISGKHIPAFISGVCKNINTLNESDKKYNIIFNNCAMAVLNDLRYAKEFNVPYFTKYYWLTNKLHKLIETIVKI